ncbi:AtpZ/AtpI family protein [Priestia taiwanensis]|uniref:Membrane protein n=1 Tax=Priestia taiwanensis TaxID=1347902 RepID=A0A917AWF9_9BACI|nr:AtpZ/AtpI family protein [Priestia taiwanensis]MBM7364996.1 F0F1-type ATP synthase assembly protein I [Priestia taiwanensis]GGE81908.1 membrane protein [Priestia taiwanensis]
MPGNNRNPMGSIGLMTSISSTLVGAILVGIFLGKWIDERFDTDPLFLILGLLFGLGTGIYGMIRIVQQFYSKEK